MGFWHGCPPLAVPTPQAGVRTLGTVIPFLVLTLCQISSLFRALALSLGVATHSLWDTGQMTPVSKPLSSHL